MPRGVFKRKPCTEETKRKISLKKRGKSTWNKELIGWANGTKAGFQKGNKIGKINKGRKIPEMMGKNNPAKRPEVGLKISLALKNNPKISEENSYLWKGNGAGYNALHSWIRKKLGKPKVCHNCKTEVAKKYEWANISKEYKRELSDWVRLCTSCHRFYDNGKLFLA